MRLCIAQVPMAVQEFSVASGTIDAAVASCFYQVRMKHLSWAMSLFSLNKLGSLHSEAIDVISTA